jgi:hypothetical protein
VRVVKISFHKDHMVGAQSLLVRGRNVKRILVKVL